VLDALSHWKLSLQLPEQQSLSSLQSKVILLHSGLGWHVVVVGTPTPDITSQLPEQQHGESGDLQFVVVLHEYPGGVHEIGLAAQP
jgi:hypothetical protein